MALSANAPAQARAERQTRPVLEFPEAGLDDTAAYRGYTTRLYRDARGNVVQIYVDARSGRVVQLWADAANESIGFTARDSAGNPAALAWGRDSATVGEARGMRMLAYRLTGSAPRLAIGWPLLGSMRVERDFQYTKGNLEPFDAAPFHVAEFDTLVATVARLAAAERRRHLALLHASSVAELRARLRPTVTTARMASGQAVRVRQTSLDGRSHLALELRVDPREAAIAVTGPVIDVRSLHGRPIDLLVTIATDAAPLTPLRREEIFNPAFLRFLGMVRLTQEHLAGVAQEAASPVADSALLRYRWLMREVTGVELLSSEEKLMAGLPNYATYFGRDMMMTALMMRSIWTAAMSERVIASVLRKLGPAGDVSHEEALGGQAIREGAAEYAALVAESERLARSGARRGADSVLARARGVLRDLQAVRENYHMIDDEFQLPVLAARYLGDPGVPAERKRAFLLRKSRGGATQLALLLRELGLVASLAAPYAREPVPANLVSFVKLDSTHWRSASWRDSGAGYANGRFAMDINAIWVPRALEGIGVILRELRAVGIAGAALDSLISGGATPLAEYARDPGALDRAVRAWGGAWRHFVVSLSPAEVRSRVAARLAAMPAAERDYWQSIPSLAAAGDSLTFLALSLDSAARPIPVVNTDPSTWLFLGDLAAADAPVGERRARVLRDVRATMRPYPVGLFVERLGPVVANDAYASPAVWEAFVKDTYHSPRVVWGREVNLFLLGVAGRLSAVSGAAGGAQPDLRSADSAVVAYARELADAVQRTSAAVEASGLKHAELWSYRVENGRLVPERYGSGSDVQLWSATDLAVQYELSRLPRP